MKLKFNIAFVAMLAGFLGYGQENRYSLMQAQEYAVKHSYSVQTASLEVEKSKKILFENIAKGLPQVYSSALWSQNISLQTFIVDDGQGNLIPLTFGTPYNATANINAEQLIFDGSYIVAIMAADVLKQNSINEQEKSEIDIKELVAQSYHLVLVSQKTIEILDTNIKFIEKNYNESKRMFEVGFLEEQDVDQLELILSNLKNNRDYAIKQLEVAFMLLKFQMGIPVENEVSLSDDIETLMLFSQDGQSLLNENFNLENHIDYRSILTQEEGQNLNLKNEQMAFLPKIKFNYNYGYDIFSEFGNVFKGEQGAERADYTRQNIAFNVELPILTGGSRSARVQQAKIQIDQVEIAKKQIADKLKLDFARAKAEYDFALNAYFTQKRNVEISQKIRDVNAKKFSEGMVSSLEFTQAENQFQDALKSVIDAANNVLNKKVQLEKILGNYNKIYKSN